MKQCSILDPETGAVALPVGAGPILACSINTLIKQSSGQQTLTYLAGRVWSQGNPGPARTFLFDLWG